MSACAALQAGRTRFFASSPALNFPGGPSETWGSNFSRDMRRRTETARWTGWKRPFALSKISLAGDLAGLPALPARQLRSLTPYSLASLEELQNPSNRNLLGRAGLDFRYGVRSSTEADLTVNTDFAETEADAQQFNFGRTSLFFPEKRLFFLQRSQTFDFGPWATTLPFFSRRWARGLDDTSVPIPINAGLKLTGRLRRTESARLRSRPGPRRANRRQLLRRAREVQRRPCLLPRGSLHRYRTGHGRSFAKVLADVRSRHSPQFTPEWTENGFYVETSNPGISGETKAWKAELNYRGEYANVELHFPTSAAPAISRWASSPRTASTRISWTWS